MLKRSFSRRSLRGPMVLMGAAAATSLSALTYAYLIEPRWIDIRRVTLVLPRLSPVFNGYRIVQISDIHMNGFMSSKRLAAVVALINEQRPDLVALTGDFITTDVAYYANGLVGALRSLSPCDATVAVLGNHDHWSDACTVRQVIRDSGLIELSNSIYSVQRGNERLHVGGVDDVCEHQDNLDRVLAALPDDGAAILLAHEPDYADTSARSGRFDLQLSGHSHGGQVRIPFVGPPILPPLGRKYPAGLYRVRDMWLYTNRGIGLIAPRVRFNCRPEIGVFTLRAPS